MRAKVHAGALALFLPEIEPRPEVVVHWKGEIDVPAQGKGR